MRFETRIDIDAAPDIVWSAVRDITRWPQFIASMDTVTPLDDEPLDVGSQVRIKQPRMPAMVWLVTAWDEGKSFTWQTRSAGVLTTGLHTVAPRDDGGTTLTLGIEQTGALAPLIGLLSGARTRRYVGIEGASLKADSEARASGEATPEVADGSSDEDATTDSP